MATNIFEKNGQGVVNRDTISKALETLGDFIKAIGDIVKPEEKK